MGMIHKQKPHVVMERIIAGATPNHTVRHLHNHRFLPANHNKTWSVGSVLNVENKNLVDPAPPLSSTVKNTQNSSKHKKTVFFSSYRAITGQITPVQW
jgi:hypothetical protein